MAGTMAKLASSMDFGLVLRIAYLGNLGWRLTSGIPIARRYDESGEEIASYKNVLSIHTPPYYAVRLIKRIDAFY